MEEEGNKPEAGVPRVFISVFDKIARNDCNNRDMEDISTGLAKHKISLFVKHALILRKKFLQKAIATSKEFQS